MIKTLLFGKTKNNQAIIMLVLLLLAIVLALSPLKIVSLILLIYALSRLVPISYGVIGKMVVSFLIIVCVNDIVAAIAWIARVPLSSGDLLSLYSFLLICLMLFHKPTALRLKQPYKLFDLNDWLSVLLAVATVFVLMMPILPHINASTLGPTIMIGGDNSEHLQLLKADDLNRGYSYGQHNFYNLPASNASYSQGWHVNGAFLKWVAQGVVTIGNHPGKVLAFFYFYSLLWFGIFVFLILRIALSLELDKKEGWSKLAKLAPLAVCAIVVAGWFLPLFADGFEPELGSFTLLLFEVLLLTETYKQKPSKRYPYLLLAGLAMVGINFTWVFLAPIAMLAVGVAVLHTFIQNKKVPPLYFIVIGIFLFISSLFQIWAELTYPNNSGGINADGFIQNTTMWCLIGILLIISVYMYYSYKKIGHRIVYFLSLLAIAISLMLMGYQEIKTGSLHYYYFKSTYTFIILSTILIASLAHTLLNKLLDSRPIPKIPKVVHIVTLGIIFVVIATMGLRAYKSPIFDEYYHKEVAGVSPGQATAIATIVNKDSLAGLYIVPIGSCDRGEDIRADELAQALVYNYKYLNTEDIITPNLSAPNEQVLFGNIKTYFDGHPNTTIYVISSDQTISNQLLSYLGSQSKYVDLINLDGNPTATNAAVCPNRIVN
jgi:hypothetical protein